MDNKESQRAPANVAEKMSSLFASMVMQHANMAFIFLGIEPHPETGKVVQDLEHARYFINQLEMLETKTKGNLDKQEEALLKQSLASLRMAFVETASKSPAPSHQPTVEPAHPVAPGVGAEEEPHKKFSKTY